MYHDINGPDNFHTGKMANMLDDLDKTNEYHINTLKKTYGIMKRYGKRAFNVPKKEFIKVLSNSNK